MQIVFFRTPRPRQFHYEPRYWDKEKERKAASSEETTDPHSVVRREIARHWRKADKRNRLKARSINLIIYVIIVLMLIYFILM